MNERGSTWMFDNGKHRAARNVIAVLSDNAPSVCIQWPEVRVGARQLLERLP